MGSLAQSALEINGVGGEVEAINSTGPNGDLCGGFTVRAKYCQAPPCTPFPPPAPVPKSSTPAFGCVTAELGLSVPLLAVICLSVCLSVRLSVCLFLQLPVCLLFADL